MADYESVTPTRRESNVLNELETRYRRVYKAQATSMNIVRLSICWPPNVNT